MVAQPGFCQTWSQTPKIGFLATRLIFFCFQLFTAESKSGCADSEQHINTADVEMISLEETSKDKNRNIPKADDDSSQVITDGNDPPNEEFGIVTTEEKSHLLSKNIDILETLSAVCMKIDIVKVVVKYLMEYLYVSKGESICKILKRAFKIFAVIILE